MDFMAFIKENMYMTAAALYVLGMFLKAAPRVADWLIPFILTAAGAGAGIALLGVPEGIIQGILCAGGAVLANQCIKQAVTRNGEK